MINHYFFLHIVLFLLASTLIFINFFRLDSLGLQDLAQFYFLMIQRIIFVWREFVKFLLNFTTQESKFLEKKPRFF